MFLDFTKAFGLRASFLVDAEGAKMGHTVFEASSFNERSVMNGGRGRSRICYRRGFLRFPPNNM